jgi:prevent-host-death family protein
LDPREKPDDDDAGMLPPDPITLLARGQIMTVQINIAEAKAKLSELLDRALAGEDIDIARAGQPLARLVPVAELMRRKPGAWRHWKVPPELLLEPMDPEDLDAAEGKIHRRVRHHPAAVGSSVRPMLDAHAVIWWLLDALRLSAARAAVGYEIAYKQRSGRLPQMPGDLSGELRHERMAALPGPHRDPWDRIMMAQALTEKCQMVTVDRVFSDYDVPVLW